MTDIEIIRLQSRVAALHEALGHADSLFKQTSSRQGLDIIQDFIDVTKKSLASAEAELAYALHKRTETK